MLTDVGCVKWLFEDHRLNPQTPAMSVYEYVLRDGWSECLATEEQQAQFLNNNILILETRLNQLHLNSDTQLTRKHLYCPGKERHWSIFSEIQKIAPIKPLRFEISLAKIYWRESVQVVVSWTSLLGAHNRRTMLAKNFNC